MHDQPYTPAPLPNEAQTALIDAKTFMAMAKFRSRTSLENRYGTKGFPTPIRLSQRCTRFRYTEVVAWIESLSAEPPADYRREVEEQAAA